MTPPLALTLRTVDNFADRLEIYYGEKLVATTYYGTDGLGITGSYSWRSYIEAWRHPDGTPLWVSSREHLADAVRDIEWLLRFRPVDE
jgi:hypothetical protein